MARMLHCTNDIITVSKGDEDIGKIPALACNGKLHPSVIPSMGSGGCDCDRSGGIPGADGKDGKSAYEIALTHGFVGTEKDWLSSLVGSQGVQGLQGLQGSQGLDIYETWKALDTINNTLPFDEWIASYLRKVSIRVGGNLKDRSISANTWATVTPLYGSGLASMVSGNILIAPISGLYIISVSARSSVGGTNFIGIWKSSSNIKEPTQSSGISVSGNSGNFSTFTKLIWLGKNESIIIQLCSTVAQSTINHGNAGIANYEFALLTSGEDGTPPGTIVNFAGTALPIGYLKADGTDVSRTTYANLFAAIGTAYGVGDGSTTFNIPDMSASGGSLLVCIKY